MNLFDGIMSGPNGVANRLMELFGNDDYIEVNFGGSAVGTVDPATGGIVAEPDEWVGFLSSPPLEVDKDTDQDGIVQKGDNYFVVQGDLPYDFNVAYQVRYKTDQVFKISKAQPIYSGNLIAGWKLFLTGANLV